MTDIIEHIKAGGEVQTCGGLEVRVYAIDAGGTYPIHGAVCKVHWEAE